jgi:hypothetical protein
MKKIILLMFSVFFYALTFASIYSYSFSGKMDISQISNYEKECLKFNQVLSVKIKYKVDSQKGEVIIITKEIPKDKSRQGMELFTPTDIKNFLISKGLTPMTFKELKK